MANDRSTDFPMTILSLANRDRITVRATRQEVEDLLTTSPGPMVTFTKVNGGTLTIRPEAIIWWE